MYENDFKEGDIIIGTKKNGYGITNKKNKCLVTLVMHGSQCDCNDHKSEEWCDYAHSQICNKCDMLVEVIEGMHTGEEYCVVSCDKIFKWLAKEEYRTPFGKLINNIYVKEKEKAKCALNVEG